MAQEIRKARVRASLAPRREPYWGPSIAKGRVLGFRKIDTHKGSWIARTRDETGRKTYKSLGLVSDAFDYEAAREAAQRWFRTMSAGVSGHAVTVADACREYVLDRRREKGDACAHDAEKRFERVVYRRPFGAVPLAKLHASRIREWRDRMNVSKATANRNLIAWKAAMNLAVANRRVRSEVAREWADVRPFSVTPARRTLFLDLRQRRALIDAASGGLRDLLEGVALTGARAGEIVRATRSQFDSRAESMTFTSKTGSRTVPLSGAAVELFQRLARFKLPNARLFVRDNGTPWAHSDWDQPVREAAHAARLPPGVCLYTLRHSFIIQALCAGLPTLEVSRLVGTSLQMIEKHYGYLVADSMRVRLAGVKML